MYSQSQGVPLESTPVVSHGVPVSSGHTVTVSAGVPIHAVSGAPVGQPVGVVHGAVSHGHPLGAVPETIKPVLSIENPVSMVCLVCLSAGTKALSSLTGPSFHL